MERQKRVHHVRANRALQCCEQDERGAKSERRSFANNKQGNRRNERKRHHNVRERTRRHLLACFHPDERANRRKRRCHGKEVRVTLRRGAKRIDIDVRRNGQICRERNVEQRKRYQKHYEFGIAADSHKSTQRREQTVIATLLARQAFFEQNAEHQTYGSENRKGDKRRPP